MAPVEDLIPHRRPWLLVDRVIEVADKRVRAEKRLARGDFLDGEGAFPELLVVEALAQTCACLRGSLDGVHSGMLVQIAAVDFGERARAGDTIALTATEIARLGALHRFAAEATVGGKLIARGELTFAVQT